MRTCLGKRHSHNISQVSFRMLGASDFTNIVTYGAAARMSGHGCYMLHRSLKNLLPSNDRVSFGMTSGARSILAVDIEMATVYFALF